MWRSRIATVGRGLPWQCWKQLAPRARLATAGEFTRLLNGRMNLTQAEAVAEMISPHSRRRPPCRNINFPVCLGKRLLFGLQLDALRIQLTLAGDFPDDEGIEVYLDVVFNHTAEGNEYGPYFSFKGIDNNIYYMLTPDGYYYNFSGCGNTLNCNHPIVQQMIIECLRY